MNRAQYVNKDTIKTEQFFDSLMAQAKADSKDEVLDSVQIEATVKGVNLSESSMSVPKCVQDVLDSVKPEDQGRILSAVMNGMNVYHREHGQYPTADLLQNALHQGVASTKSLKELGVLDSIGSSSHHDVLSAQPGRTIVAIVSAIAEAIPFATYLPADITSNQARLALVAHKAGNAAGAYAEDDILDGIESGDTFISSERRVDISLNVGRTTGTGKINAVEGTTADVILLRGRAIIYVNGLPCAYENSQTQASVAAVPVSGVATLSGTDYAISGTVTTATGAIALAFDPALPSGTVVEAEGYIDYEKQPTLAPRIVTHVQTFDLYANPWRALADQTIDSRNQYANELSLDLQAENIMAIRTQHANERHYSAIKKMKAIGAKNNAESFDFNWTDQIAQKTRSQVWQDFSAKLGIVDQRMAEQTIDHGITHIYVTKSVGAQMLALPSELFTKSGLVARPGIYRIGTLFGRYEVYYTPKGLAEDINAGTAEMLCIGRSTQVARCPIVIGDAVPPIYLPLAMDGAMKYANGFYARGFTCVNPHTPSAMGAALISITGLVE